MLIGPVPELVEIVQVARVASLGGQAGSRPGLLELCSDGHHLGQDPPGQLPCARLHQVRDPELPEIDRWRPLALVVPCCSPITDKPLLELPPLRLGQLLFQVQLAQPGITEDIATVGTAITGNKTIDQGHRLMLGHPFLQCLGSQALEVGARQRPQGRGAKPQQVVDRIRAAGVT